MTICCIIKCSNTIGRDKHVSYHRIPAIIARSCSKTLELSTARRALWFSKINRGDGFATDAEKLKRVVVCGRHFVKGCPSDLFDNTNVDWAPNLHLGYGDDSKALKRATTANERDNRAKNRKRNKTGSADIENQAAVAQDSVSLVINDDNAESQATTTRDSVSTDEQPHESSSGNQVEATLEIFSGMIGAGDIQGVIHESDLHNSGSVVSSEMETLRNLSDGACHSGKSKEDFSCQVNLSHVLEYNSSISTNFKELISSAKHEISCQTETSYEHMGTQTELSNSQITLLENVFGTMQSDLWNMRQKVHDLMLFTEEKLSLQVNEHLVKFYTGLPNYKVFNLVFRFVSKHLPKETHRNSLTQLQECVLFLIRIRLNVPITDLAYRFNISQATASRIFYKWLDIMHIRLKPLIKWPKREDLWNAMPQAFKLVYGNKVAVIIDCFEVFIERPSSLEPRAITWSNYKHHNTIKYLLGISPAGTIIYISNGYGGRSSDKRVTEDCGILNNILPGDAVLADRGFNIAENLGHINATLIIPSFTRGKSQLDLIETELSREASNLRIHVERIIGHVRQKYKILNGPVPIELLHKDGSGVPFFDKITTIACALTNLNPSIVSQV